jgi:FAD/FMN-containing dehydrogenase
MADVRIVTTTDAETAIETAAVDALKASLRGELLRAGDDGYDEARKVWNGMIDKRPGLIARCAGVADVISAVDFARTHQLLMSVRGGGHNIPGNQLGNAANRISAQETAFSHRDALCEWGCLSSWADPAADGANIRWTRELAEAMQPFSSGGAYITQMGIEAEEGADRIKAAYGPNYEQLAALKNKYDPTNLFRHNQNIKPAS